MVDDVVEGVDVGTEAFGPSQDFVPFAATVRHEPKALLSNRVKEIVETVGVVEEDVGRSSEPHLGWSVWM